jgi:hypothetical protein
VTANPDDESAEHLRVLAAGLIKCGVPVQFRADADRRPYLRASHPGVPLSTDVYCVSDETGFCSYRSEWGRTIARADDPVSAIGYVVRLLRIFPR